MARRNSWRLCVALFTIAAADFAHGCGSALQGSGVMQSPNYPSDYADNDACTWTLQASPAQGSIFLHFEAFSTEDCCDHVVITDATGSTYTYSGSQLPPDLTLGPQATVAFTADYSVVDTGFFISFTTLAAPTCGGAIQGSGVMQSPNYPIAYPNYASCTWTLQASPARGSIILQFQAFATEKCCDFVRVTDGNGLSYSFSGSALPGNLTLAQQATVVFTADYSIAYAGFSISFTTIVFPCGGIINGSGVILSPNYPGSYPNFANCTWTLLASPLTDRLFIQFNSFAVQDGYDFLAISDSSGLSFSFTGNSLPPNLTLSQQSTMIFASDYRGALSGFLISVRTIGCVTRSGGVFSPLASVTFPAPSFAPGAVISNASERSSIECGATCLHCDYCVAFTYNPISRGCSLISYVPRSFSPGVVQLYVRV